MSVESVQAAWSEAIKIVALQRRRLLRSTEMVAVLAARVVELKREVRRLRLSNANLGRRNSRLSRRIRDMRREIRDLSDRNNAQAVRVHRAEEVARYANEQVVRMSQATGGVDLDTAIKHHTGEG